MPNSRPTPATGSAREDWIVAASFTSAPPAAPAPPLEVSSMTARSPSCWDRLSGVSVAWEMNPIPDAM